MMKGNERLEWEQKLDGIKNIAFLNIAGCICSKVNGEYFWKDYYLGNNFHAAEETLKEIQNRLMFRTNE